MTRTKVNSEIFRSIGYEPDSELLELEFVTGDILDYQKVQPYLYMGLMNTSAKDIYFEQYIKGRYKFEETPVKRTGEISLA